MEDGEIWEDTGFGGTLEDLMEDEDTLEDPNNMTSWEHPPPYVITTRWIVEGVLLPSVGAIGIVGEANITTTITKQPIHNCLHLQF